MEARIAFLLSILIACVVGLFSPNAQGAGLSNPTPIHELFQKAVKLGGYEGACSGRPNGCEMPMVLLVKLENDNHAGEFHPRLPDFVKINTSNRVPGSLDFNATVIHEFVHYLQWLTGKLGPQTKCSGLYEIESPAYAAAAAYLSEFGIVKDFSDQLFSTQIMSMMCAGEGH